MRMNTKDLMPNRALVWKDIILLKQYFLLFIGLYVLISIFILDVGRGANALQYTVEGLIAYAPFIIAVFCGTCTVASIVTEITDKTIESLLCTPLDLKEILFTKILIIAVVPAFISLFLIIPLIIITGIDITWPLLYQIIADFPLALLFISASVMTWLLRAGRLYQILSAIVVSIFFLSIFGYFGILKLFFRIDLPLSPFLTTVFLVFSVPGLFLMYRRMGEFEKSEVI
jgi:ABC-type Na+ efflux pump permease subunit